MLAGKEIRERGGVIAQRDAGHFRGGELDVEDLQIVDQAVLEAAVAEPRRERQRRRVGLIAGLAAVGDVLDEPIAHHRRGERRAIEVHPDARRAARSVVGDRQSRPLVQCKGARGAYGDRVAGPEMNQAKERPAVVERQLVAAAAGIGPGSRLMQNDRARLALGRHQPNHQRERIGAAEAPGPGMHNPVVAAEPQRTSRARGEIAHELRTVLQRGRSRGDPIWCRVGLGRDVGVDGIERQVCDRGRPA